MLAEIPTTRTHHGYKRKNRDIPIAEDNIEMLNVDVPILFNEFGAKNEVHLRTKLMGNDWMLAKCPMCRRKINLLSCRWIDGNPVCLNNCRY